MNAKDRRSNLVAALADGNRLVSLARRRHGVRELTAANMTNCEVQAVPMAFLPVYARRWQAYRNDSAPIVATKGWDR